MKKISFPSRSLSENYDFAGLYPRKWEETGVRTDKVGKKALMEA